MFGDGFLLNQNDEQQQKKQLQNKDDFTRKTTAMPAMQHRLEPRRNPMFLQDGIGGAPAPKMADADCGKQRRTASRVISVYPIARRAQSTWNKNLIQTEKYISCIICIRIYQRSREAQRKKSLEVFLQKKTIRNCSNQKCAFKEKKQQQQHYTTNRTAGAPNKPAFIGDMLFGSKVDDFPPGHLFAARLDGRWSMVMGFHRRPDFYRPQIFSSNFRKTPENGRKMCGFYHFKNENFGDRPSHPSRSNDASLQVRWSGVFWKQTFAPRHSTLHSLAPYGHHACSCLEE